MNNLSMKEVTNLLRAIEEIEFEINNGYDLTETEVLNIARKYIDMNSTRKELLDYMDSEFKSEMRKVDYYLLEQLVYTRKELI